MKFFLKLLIVALVLAVLLPFTFLKDDSGRPLMSLDKLKAPDIALPTTPDVKLPNLGNDDGRQDIVYQWRDAEIGQLDIWSRGHGDIRRL